MEVLFAINDRTKDESSKKPYRLILGLTYNATTGLPFPLPFVSYFRRINERLVIRCIGVPKSNIKYFFNEKNITSDFCRVLDGYFAHSAGTIKLFNGKKVDNISLSVCCRLADLDMSTYFTKHLVAYYVYRLHISVK